MTSLEIADLTGKEHRNVLADIRAMLNETGGLLTFQQPTYTPPTASVIRCSACRSARP